MSAGPARPGASGSGGGRALVGVATLSLNVSRSVQSPLPGFRYLEGGAEGGLTLAWARAADTAGHDVGPTIDDRHERTAAAVR